MGDAGTVVSNREDDELKDATIASMKQPSVSRSSSLPISEDLEEETPVSRKEWSKHERFNSHELDEDVE